MIRIEYCGRFGNNMFSYAYARCIAKTSGLALLSNLPDGGYLTNTTNEPGLIYNTSPIYLEDSDRVDYNTPSIFENKTYVIRGFFQNASYYTDKPFIKSFFNIPKLSLNKDDLVIHVRLSDYKEFGPLGTVLDPTYYLRAIEKINFNKLYIVTDEPTDSAYLGVFKRYSPEIINQDPKSDFIFLMNFEKIIISNSTFAWWAAYLGNALEIYSPSVWLRYCVHIKDLNRLPGATIVEASWL